MAKIWVLMKLNFRALLSSMRLGSSKKGKVGGVGALALLCALSLYISGTYSFIFGEILSKSGMLDFLLPLIGLIGLFLAVMMTLFAASGFIFSNKDSDLMLSLPVSAFSVMLSKILALYLESLVFVALFLIPSGVAYLVYGGEGGVLFIVRLLIAAVFLPVLATLLSTIIAYFVSWLSAHSKHKSMASTILTFLFLGVVMVLSFQLNNLGAVLQQNKETVERLLGSWLLPFGLMQRGVLGSWTALLEFCVLCLVPFLAIVWLFSTRYKKILSGLASQSVRSDYKLEKLQASSQFSALFNKELRRYFGSSIYFTNTAFGGILMLGGCIYAAVVRDKGLAMISQLGGADAIMPLVLAVLAFMLSTINTTCVSISLEGKSFWILKEAPVSAKTIFRAKLALNLLIGWPVTVVSVLILGVAYSVPALNILAMLAVLLPMEAAVALFGLIVNLQFPKMDADNDTVVVKQSASALVGIFGGWIPVIAGAGLYLLAGEFLGFALYCLCFGAVLCLLCLLYWLYLSKRGTKKLNQL